jgi:hypothetical protein
VEAQFRLDCISETELSGSWWLGSTELVVFSGIWWLGCNDLVVFSGI